MPTALQGAFKAQLKSTRLFGLAIALGGTAALKFLFPYGQPLF
jgi:hypothetical protein